MLKQRALLALILLYSALLFSAALPDLGPLGKIQKLAYSWLSSVSIVPGLKLFYRPFVENYKIHGQCIEFKGYDRLGHVWSLYRTPTGCLGPPPVHWIADIFEIMYHRFNEEAALSRLAAFSHLGDKVFAPGFPMYPRELAVYQAVGDFFCHSGLVDRPVEGLLKVAMVWRQDKIEYTSGNIERPYQLFTDWDCGSHTLEFAQWRPHFDTKKMDAFLHDQVW